MRRHCQLFWGKKNAFIKDEGDAFVGVVSNVPSSTLVGGLFELLRSGGSHSFLGRLRSNSGRQFYMKLAMPKPPGVCGFESNAVPTYSAQGTIWL